MMDPDSSGTRNGTSRGRLKKDVTAAFLAAANRKDDALHNHLSKWENAPNNKGEEKPSVDDVSSVGSRSFNKTSNYSSERLANMSNKAELHRRRRRQIANLDASGSSSNRRISSGENKEELGTGDVHNPRKQSLTIDTQNFSNGEGIRENPNLIPNLDKSSSDESIPSKGFVKNNIFVNRQNRGRDMHYRKSSPIPDNVQQMNVYESNAGEKIESNHMSGQNLGRNEISEQHPGSAHFSGNRHVTAHKENAHITFPSSTSSARVKVTRSNWFKTSEEDEQGKEGRETPQDNPEEHFRVMSTRKSFDKGSYNSFHAQGQTSENNSEMLREKTPSPYLMDAVSSGGKVTGNWYKNQDLKTSSTFESSPVRKKETESPIKKRTGVAGAFLSAINSSRNSNQISSARSFDNRSIRSQMSGCEDEEAKTKGKLDIIDSGHTQDIEQQVKIPSRNSSFVSNTPPRIMSMTPPRHRRPLKHTSGVPASSMESKDQPLLQNPGNSGLNKVSNRNFTSSPRRSPPMIHDGRNQKSTDGNFVSSFAHSNPSSSPKKHFLSPRPRREVDGDSIASELTTSSAQMAHLPISNRYGRELPNYSSNNDHREAPNYNNNDRDNGFGNRNRFSSKEDNNGSCSEQENMFGRLIQEMESRIDARITRMESRLEDQFNSKMHQLELKMENRLEEMKKSMILTFHEKEYVTMHQPKPGYLKHGVGKQRPY